MCYSKRKIFVANMEKNIIITAPVQAASSKGRKIVRKAKKFSESVNSPSRRKSLQLLQPMAGSQTQLVGTDGVVRLTNQTSKTPKRKFACDGKSQPKKVFRPDGGKNFTIFEDKSQTSTNQSASSEQESIDMMTQATPTAKYWEELAEERRAALEETLKENEELYSENAQLKEENVRLKVVADQAEYLADVVETLIGKQTEDKEEERKEAENATDVDKENVHRVPTEGCLSDYEQEGDSDAQLEDEEVEHDAVFGDTDFEGNVESDEERSVSSSSEEKTHQV